MADIGWGNHENTEDYGRPFDTPTDFAIVDFQDSLDKYKEYMHASHGMIFMRTDDLLWELYPLRGAVMMQMRFDGNIGFPGGLRDDDEAPVEVLNREMKEEINLDLDKFAFTQKHYSTSHMNAKKKLVTHFFIREVSQEEFGEIERQALSAPEWGVEAYGVIRVPLTILGDGFRGLPVFLANRFAGNAKEQLLGSIRKSNLIPEQALSEIMLAHDKYLNTLKNQLEDNIAMDHFATNSCADYTLISQDQISQYSHCTQAAHALIYCCEEGGKDATVLMHLRFDGFLGFPGGLADEGESVEQSLNRELKEEIGWNEKHLITSSHHCMSHINEKTKLCLHFYMYQVDREDLVELEHSLMTSQEYGIEVLGPVRVPVLYLSTFLHNAFIGNSSDQLTHALDIIAKNNEASDK